MINVIKQFGNRYLIDPITMTAIGLGGGAILGQLGGQYLAGKQAQAMAGSNRLQALATLAQALNKPPEIQDIQYQQYEMPEEYQLVGSYTPEALTDTQLRQLKASPEFRQAQLDVLQKYKEQGEQGLTAIDRAALADIQNELARQERGQREAILANMAQRGMAGSGQELASSLLAGQESAQRASQEGMRLAAQQQANRQEALARVAQMSGGLEQTDYERAANVAMAQDVINQFNVANRIQSGRELQATKQRLAEQNIAQENAIRQANIDLINQQRQQNIVNKPLAQYGLQSQYTSGIAGGLGSMAGSQAQQAMNQYQTQAQLLGAGIQTGGTLAGMYAMRQPTQTAQTAQPTKAINLDPISARQQEIRNQYSNIILR
jgi:hypothetical protein